MEGDWDISCYRNKFEPDEQWEMRRKFMEENKHNLPEDRVVCLAQVLVNMEFLGTKYPIETMRTVNELSQEIIGEFRERQKSRLQRTFVGGTDAASAIAKGKQPASALKRQTELRTAAESNASYFLSAILSSRSTVVQAETTLKQEGTSKLNTLTIASTGNGNKTESRKRKKKKEARSVEETLTDNVTSSSDCMVTLDSSEVSRQTEEISEPICKKKKKRKRKKRNVTVASTGNDNKTESRKKKKEDRSVEETLTDNVTSSSDCMVTLDSLEVSRQTEEISEPICNKKKRMLKNASGDTRARPNYRQILEDSARLSAVQLEIVNHFLDNQKKWEIVLLLDGKKIASSLHENQNLSTKDISKQAFTILEKTQYQIVITDKKCDSVGQFMMQEEDARLTRAENMLSTKITKADMTEKAKAAEDCSTDHVLEILSKRENAIVQPFQSTAAMKMMKMMGWSEGTGLGLQKQGIIEPIKSEVVVGRKGIGYDGSENAEHAKPFQNKIRRYLKNYMNSASVHNIVFSKEFSNEERRLIHGVARKMGMLSSSLGKGPNRQLTVRRSRCEPRPLIELLNRLKESKKSDPIFSRINLISPTGSFACESQ